MQGQDIGPLIDMLNSRFDDVISRIDSVKADLIRAHDKHESDDKVRFDKHEVRLSDIEKLKWKLTGAVSLAFVLMQGLWKFLEKTVFT